MTATIERTQADAPAAWNWSVSEDQETRQLVWDQVAREQYELPIEQHLERRFANGRPTDCGRCGLRIRPNQIPSPQVDHQDGEPYYRHQACDEIDAFAFDHWSEQLLIDIDISEAGDFILAVLPKPED